MKPIGWTKRSVQLQCDSCGSHNRLELLPYLVAVNERTALRCERCGAETLPEDRRRADTSRSDERRVAIAT